MAVVSESEYRADRSTPSSRKPAAVFDAFTVRSIAVRCVSLRGDRHRSGAREDDYRVGMSSDGQTVVFAVADGVSAAPHSALGSELVCYRAIESLESRPGRTQEALATARESLAEFAQRHGQEPAQYSTTLLVAAIWQGADVSVDLAFIGDFTVAVLKPGGSWFASDTPRTRRPPSLPEADTEAAQSLTVDLKAHQALFIMTDGLGDGLPRKAVREALAKRWREGPPSGVVFVADSMIEVDDLWDDRTVIGIWRISDSAPGDI